MVKSKEQVKEVIKSHKPPVKPEKITLDDFMVEVDGDEYFPHKDEWVDIIPIRQLSSLRNLMKLASFSTENITVTNPALLDQYDNLTIYLSDVIYDWNLTDDNEQPLPKPFKKPEVFDLLSLDEINYLVAKLIGGRTDESKSEPSTSS